MPLTNPVAGPPAAVLAAVLRGGPAFGQRNRATFSTSNYPDLPSLITDVVALSTSGVLDADIEVTGVLVSQGWATQAVVSVTTTYNPVPPNVAVVLCNATSAAFTVTLPDATGPGYVTGQRYTIIKTDSSGNAVTVACSAGQLISGAATASLASAFAYTSVVFDGANWQVWASSSANSSPTGAAGGALAGTYPNPSLSLPITASGSTASFGALVSVTQTGAPGGAAGFGLIGQNSSDALLGVRIAGDTNNRWRLNAGGNASWGTGSATSDTTLARAGTAQLQLTDNGTGNSPQFLIAPTTSAATTPLIQLTNHTAGDLAFGIQVTGDTSQRFSVNSNGKFQWGPGGTAVDTDLYRSTVATLTTDGALVVGGKLTVATYPPVISVAPSVATAETFPRVFAQSASPSPTSGTLYLMAIAMAGGIVVNNLTFCSKGANTGGTLTHGWYVLLDSSMIVRAVTGDQTGTISFMAANNTPYTLSTNAYTIPSAATYYAGIMIAGGTMPTWAIAGLPAANLATIPSILCGTSSTAQTTPPTAGSTLASITAAANWTMYAFTS